MIYFLTMTGYDFTVRSLRDDPGAPPISTLTHRRALKMFELLEATYMALGLSAGRTARCASSGRAALYAEAAEYMLAQRSAPQSPA